MADNLDDELDGACSPAQVGAMTLQDLEAVLQIDSESHARPWSETMFRDELAREWAYLVVAKEGDAQGALEVVAFCNYWLVHDEVHLLNIATRSSARRRGHGRRLLLHIIAFARAAGCRYVTLEVRKSNLAAQKLYQSEGFESVALRPRYYADNKEDALIMLLELAAETSFTSQKHARNNCPLLIRDEEG